MIKKENSVFLREMFGIDYTNYSEENLNKLLDKLVNELDDMIYEKEKSILELMKNSVLNLELLDNSDINNL